MVRSQTISGFQLSPQQRRLWLLDKTGRHYQVQAAFSIEGDLQPGKFKDALQYIVERHEILRTSFHTLPTIKFPIQVVDMPAPVPTQERDLTDLDARQQRKEINLIIKEEREQPFDLEQSPLLRATLIKLDVEKYVLVLTLPSLCADARTIENIGLEIGKWYSAGQSDRSTEVPVQYTQFAELQNELLTSEDFQKEREYWRNRNFSQHLKTRLPFDNYTRQPPAFEPRLVASEISIEQTRRIDTLAEANNATTSDVLLTCWQALLYRLTLHPQLVVGVRHDGRVLKGLEQALGLFAKYLPVSAQLTEDTPFSTALNLVQQSAQEAGELQEYFDLDTAIGRGVPESDPIFLPLQFDYQELQTDHSAGGVRFSTIDRYDCIERFKLKLSFIKDREKLIVRFHCDSLLYKDDVVNRLAGQFHSLLENALKNPNARLADLEIISDKERHQVLVEFNRSRSEYPQNKRIHDLIEEQSRAKPNGIAIISSDWQLTYAELDFQANRLARYLRTLGAGPDVAIGICAERSPEMFIGILGILKAGAAYVPLDPNYPLDRLSFALEDAGIKILLAQEKLAGKLPRQKAQLVSLNAEWDTLSEESETLNVIEATADNLAYIIYTSGSTGQPKGVLVSHRNLVHSTSARNSYYRDPVTGFLLASPFAFDSSVAGIFWTLCQGGSLVLPPEGFQQDLSHFIELIARHRISHLLCLPSLYSVILEQNGPQELASLRAVIVAGESCTPGLLKQHFERLPGASLYNEYGPTEATVWCSVHQCFEKDEEASVPIGRPIANTQIYILDKRLQPAPIGLPGEIYVGGTGIARGYSNRPDVTAERFIPDPFGSEPGVRLYKTGDIGRHLPDGNIEFLGRADQQVKIRGFRIELGEIEARLAEHADVRDVAVIARDDGQGHKQLVAYIVAQDGRELDRGELRRYLKERLPAFMLPSALVLLEALPLLPNGKVDRNALPDPDSRKSDLETTYAAPNSEVEEAMADIWQQVLGRSQVGVDDNFFEIGGDSIRSIQVLSRAKEKNLSFSLQQLARHPTIRELAREIIFDEQKAVEAISKPFGLISSEDRIKLPGDLEDAYPLTKLQAGMFFHSEYSPEAAVYHEVMSFHLAAPLSLEALRESMDWLASRHPMLRTSFDFTGFSEPLQLIHSNATIPLLAKDLSHLSHDKQEREIDTWFEQEKTERFDWTRAPLLRFNIHLRGQDSFQFTYTCHHAILDGWSAAAMLTELFQQYLNLIGRQSFQIDPPPSFTFRDFVALERQALESGENRRYWNEKLNGSTVATLPRWSSSPQAEGDRWDIFEVALSGEINEELKRLAGSQGVPMKSIFLAAHMRVLSVLNGQSDVLTALVYNGRPEIKDGERTLGLFVNTLPFRLQLSGGSWLDLIRQTFVAEHELLSYRHYPLTEIRRALAGQQLSEIVFNFVHFHVFQGVLDLKEIQYLGGKYFNQTNFTLSADFGVDPTTSDTSLRLEYDAAKLSEEQVETIAGHYRAALEAIARNPNSSYEDCSLLSDGEQRRLLVEWNDTTAVYPQGRLIHEEFEAQAQQYPEAIAVVFENQQLRYRELNARANRIARYLRKAGAGPETLVGICLERSLEMVAGLLGILKAGAAYLPLDTEYPAERLAFMIEDADVSLLLTQQVIREKLPRHNAQEIALDSEWDLIAQESDTDLASEVEGANLAYMIYTSGSTGQPKGAMNTHAGLLNRLQWMQETYRLTPEDRVLQKTPFSFDVSVWEFFWPLMAGACLVVAKPGGHKDPRYLIDTINQEAITTVHFVPSMLQAFIEEPEVDSCSSLKRVICSGEALPLDLQKRFYSRLKAELHNLYGPTEAAIDVTAWACERNTRRSTVPIGRPISNLKIYLLDGSLQPVPTAVPGELYIGGLGVGRGYYKRPELTAEKFLPDPFSDEPGSRFYRTGDLARYDREGNIEFLGRIDHQVKIRGLRVELGEIEAALNQHPDVRESVVLAREEAKGDKRLVAYLTFVDSLHSLEGHALRLPAEHIHDWETLYDDIHNQQAPYSADPTFNTVGWNSSYTGLPIPQDEMRFWVSSTVERILALKPRHVLEIGCGPGLLLFRIAPYCAQYVATDFSQVALDYVQQQLARRAELSHVRLYHRVAEDLADLCIDSFDLIVINSVVQYFPGCEYLLKVIESATQILSSGGHIFIGDVRNLALLDAFHASVQLDQSADSLTAEQLRQRIRKEVLGEDELLVHPAFFVALKQYLPQLGRVDIQLKRGLYQNELTRFRYDVILHIGNVASSNNREARTDWQTHKLTPGDVKEILERETPEALRVSGVPNARVLYSLKAAELIASAPAHETVGGLRRSLSEEQSETGIEPEEFWSLSNDLPYEISLEWSPGNPGSFDAVFTRKSEAAKAALAGIEIETARLCQ